MVTSYISGEVRLYDSKFSGRLPKSIEQQICQVYRNAVVNGSLPVAVQQQTGSSECRVMAIANAYHAVSGDDLPKLKFLEVHSMRNHLSR